MSFSWSKKCASMYNWVVFIWVTPYPVQVSCTVSCADWDSVHSRYNRKWSWEIWSVNVLTCSIVGGPWLSEGCSWLGSGTIPTNHSPPVVHGEWADIQLFTSFLCQWIHIGELRITCHQVKWGEGQIHLYVCVKGGRAACDTVEPL